MKECRHDAQLNVVILLLAYPPTNRASVDLVPRKFMRHTIFLTQAKQILSCKFRHTIHYVHCIPYDVHYFSKLGTCQWQKIQNYIECLNSSIYYHFSDSRLLYQCQVVLQVSTCVRVYVCTHVRVYACTEKQQYQYSTTLDYIIIYFINLNLYLNQFVLHQPIHHQHLI